MRIVRNSADLAFPLTGGKVPFTFDFVPSGFRVDSLHVEADLTVTAPAGGVTSDVQTRLLDLVETDRRLRVSGLGENALDWCVKGKDATAPVALAAGAGQAIRLFWPLTWKDRRAVAPSDFSPATAFLKGQTLNAYFANANALLAGFLVTAGTCRIVAHLAELDAGTIPASVLKGYTEVSTRETRLPAGRLVDLVLVKNDGADITDAELGNVKLSIDGRFNLLENQRLQQLLRTFNYENAEGAAQQALATGVEGEALPNETPAHFVPIYTATSPLKATQLPSADEYYTLSIDGTLAMNSARLFYRIIEEVDEVASAKAAAKLGIPVGPGDVIEGKTATKTGLPRGAPFKKTHGVMARRVAKQK